MVKYNLIFGTDFDNKKTLDSRESLTFYDNKDNKTVADIKDFITCFNDNICTCMLKLYQYENGIFGSYIRYSGKDEDTKKLKELANNSNSYIYIGQINKKCTCNFLTNNKTFHSLQKRSLIEKINELEKKSELKKVKEEEFYDIIIDINSILALREGWKIEFTEKGKEKYDNYKNDLLIKIGIVGNVNIGKTFILSKLSKIVLPTGTSISTKGLSIKYPDLEDGQDYRKYILLDSAGLENPILIDEKENEEENDQEIDNNYKKEIDKFRLKARDILITESFLQSFIISVSDLLLIVIDKLSFSEQKLINKIKGELKSNKKKKQVFIIHNLKTYRTKEQIESYINDILNKSATFKLRKGENITSNTKKIKHGVYFTELNSDNDISIYHLLFAADGSEAGNYYNDYTIDFIEEKYNNDLRKKKFDVIEEVKSKFAEYSPRYLEDKIEPNDFNNNEESLSEKLIKINGKKDFILKKCQIDEIGFQTFKKTGFEPRYNYFKNGNSLEIRAELPGNVKPVVNKPNYLDENTIISIYGEKYKDKVPEKLESNLYNSREFGNFNLEIPLKTADFKINPTIKENKIKNGILFLKYDFDVDEKDEKITVDVDEEI